MYTWWYLAVLGLLATPILAWNHASKSELEQALAARHDTVVAFIHPDNLNSQMLETEWSAITDPEKTHLSINCAVDSKLCEEYDVRSFPAIRLYRSPDTYEYYRGPRQANEITAFVDRSLRSVVSGLETSNVTDFSSIDSFVFILHLTDRDAGKGLYKRFHDLATIYSDRYSFGIIAQKEEDGTSFLDCYNNLDDLKRSMDEFFGDINSLESFMKTCASRLVAEMTHLNKVEYTKSNTKVLYYFDLDHARREKYGSDLKETARKYVDDLKFVTVDPPSFPDVAANVGLKWTFPAIALQNKGTGYMYPSEQNNDITSDFVETFIQSVVDGSAWPAFFGTEPDMESVAGGSEGIAHDEL